MTEPDAETKKLLLAQKRYGDYIANFAVNCTKLKAADRVDVTDMDNRLTLLENYWAGYKDRDDRLQEQAEKLATLGYFKDDDYTTTLNNYLAAKHWVLTKRKALETAAPAIVPINENNAARPPSNYSYIQKVNLPTYAGEQLQWELSKEKFTALILHDESITTVIKFENLSESVAGEAKQIVDGYPQLAANFQTAWDALCSRYDNQILRFNVHMQAAVQLPSAKQESASHISTLLTTIKQAFNTFTSLERPVDQWDDVLAFFLESKLAPATKKDWVKKVEAFDPKRFPTFAEMKSFLEDRLRALDMLHAEKTLVPSSDVHKGTPSTAPPKDSSQKAPKKTSAHVATQPATPTTTTRGKCALCGANHLLAHCQDFHAMKRVQRVQVVTNAHLCENCFSPKHPTSECTSLHRCFVCNEPHNTRLHPDQTTANTTKNEGNKGAPSPIKTITSTPSAKTNCYAVSTSKTVLLTMACVSPEGSSITVRALLDSGAEESFISEYVVQALQLLRRPVHVAISGVGGETSAIAKSLVTAMLKSPRDKNFEFPISALVLKKLTTVLPTKKLEESSWAHLKDLPLADPHYATPSRIDCILNTEVYSSAIRPGLHRGEDGTPVAVASVFGWLIMGPTGLGKQDREHVAVHHVRVDHELTAVLKRFWETDWLRSHPSRWKAFVGNRVSEIITLLPNARWGHVRSADNPADLATRGTTPAQLRDTPLWWKGPTWLQCNESDWPANLQQYSPDATQLEECDPMRFHAFMIQTSTELQTWLESFSSLDKLIRILAYMQRWRNNAHLPPESRRLTWVSAQEIAAARITLLGLVQRGEYFEDIKRIQRDGSVSSSSSLARLTPFLDPDGLLRVGGRLQNSFLSESEKHPIILPATHHVTQLLVNQAHRVTLHGGSTLTQSHLHRKYWVPRGRNMIRRIVRRCIKCTRHNAFTQQQLMGALPAVRLQPSRPFTFTGLDYAGPFSIRASPGRGHSQPYR